MTKGDQCRVQTERRDKGKGHKFYLLFASSDFLGKDLAVLWLLSQYDGGGSSKSLVPQISPVALLRPERSVLFSEASRVTYVAL